MDALIAAITVFVLALFLGAEIITKVPPTLHTPLMSGSNAISGITLIGAVISMRTDNEVLATVLAVVAVSFAMINVAGGYLVTNRMLAMFKGKR
ncbi:MAG: NAD(P) transhydrogenase subunit alpha [Coriobacteriia bacterium]|nr:NAD(P) transhydrogenase subunit alpha [Coriobacteriia bacterium]